MTATGRRPAAAWLLAALAVLAGSALTSCGRSRQQSVVATTARAAADRFLAGYVDPDGRVVRHDQGGDTVSEGQAYAMLLDVAVGDRTQFAAVWGWAQDHLHEPDGLLAYHWVDGAVADAHSATDADLDIARALVLAAATWHDPAYRRQGIAYAGAILADESVHVDGTVWLVAGPWARQAPYELDPSYYDPATFALLAAATGDRAWAEVSASSARVLDADTAAGTRLPSDWAQLGADGEVTPAGAPGGGPVLYGYDAFRVLVRQDDACTPGPGAALDARLVGLADRTASPSDRADTWTTSATPAEAGDDPLMLVAAAGASGAAGAAAARTSYLHQAAAAAASAPSYYLDAWVALGDYLLTTSELDGCSA